MNASNSSISFFGVDREFDLHREEIMGRIESVLESGQALQGESVTKFERRVAALVGRQYGVAVNSCTDALYFALLASGVRSGDGVLVTDFSFIASASCIARSGAVPVFVDIDLGTYNMDLRRANALLMPNTKAIVLVHLYGQMVNPSDIEAFCQAHDLILLEDAAQAIGATFDGRPAGSLGLASCISFDPTKPISAPGSGGVVVTDDPEVASRIRRLRYHGKGPNNDFVEVGYNSQMPTLTAAVLDLKLDHIDTWQARRRAIANYYVDHLCDLDIALPMECPASTHIYHKFVIRTAQRDALKAHLAACGIDTRIHYGRPLHNQPCFASLGDYDDSLYPLTIESTKTVLSLPIHPFLTDSQVETVADTIRQAHVL